MKIVAFVELKSVSFCGALVKTTSAPAAPFSALGIAGLLLHGTARR